MWIVLWTYHISRNVIWLWKLSAIILYIPSIVQVYDGWLFVYKLLLKIKLFIWVNFKLLCFFFYIYIFKSWFRVIFEWIKLIMIIFHVIIRLIIWKFAEYIWNWFVLNIVWIRYWVDRAHYIFQLIILRFGVFLIEFMRKFQRWFLRNYFINWS